MANLFLSSARGGDQTAITAAQGAQGRGELQEASETAQRAALRLSQADAAPGQPAAHRPGRRSVYDTGNYPQRDERPA